MIPQAALPLLDAALRGTLLALLLLLAASLWRLPRRLALEQVGLWLAPRCCMRWSSSVSDQPAAGDGASEIPWYWAAFGTAADGVTATPKPAGAITVGVMGLPATADLGPVTLRYPSSSPALPMRRGPFLFNLAHNGLPARGNGRLVVVSHGTGGSPAVHAALARALVRAADVMALPEHVGDTDRDYSTKGNSESPNRRPLEVSRTSPFGPSPLRSRLDATASARLGMLPRMGRAPRGPVSVLWCPSRSATAAGP